MSIVSLRQDLARIGDSLRHIPSRVAVESFLTSCVVRFLGSYLPVRRRNVTALVASSLPHSISNRDARIQWRYPPGVTHAPHSSRLPSPIELKLRFQNPPAGAIVSVSTRGRGGHGSWGFTQKVGEEDLNEKHH